MQIPLSEILERGISHRPRPSEHYNRTGGAGKLLHVDDTSIVLEKFTAKPRNFRGNTVGILDVSLAEVFEHATETVIPALLLLGRLTGVGGSELNKQSVTY